MLRARDSYLCGHCNRLLGKTAYFNHKRLFYDHKRNRWSRRRVVSDTESVPFTLSSDSEEDTMENTEHPIEPPSEEIASQSSDHDQCSSEESQPEPDDDDDSGIEMCSEDDLDLLINDELPPSYEANVAKSNTMRLYVFFLFMFQSLFRLSDTALNILFSFLAQFFRMLAQKIESDNVVTFLRNLPRTLHAARKFVGASRDPFRKYVCCPTCESLYVWEDCILKESDGSLVSKKCSYVQFPSHPQIQHRKECGAILMKTLKTRMGNTLLYPRRIYCYRSIIESLQELIKRPGFSEKCEAWRSRVTHANVYGDVYDGEIWKSFLSYNGRPFLSLPYNYVFSINVDWFQPYDRTQHSEGVIYMAVMNLPRTERFLQENIILVGVIPGPHEPSLNINTFLRPLVDELMQLWCGVKLVTKENVSVFVRAALICAACDIPAARKTCGFLGHQATMGCSKCLTSFPGSFGEKHDYSNFDRVTWKPRTGFAHRSIALDHQACQTKSDQHDIEHATGVRYSVLVDLPYFDAPKMCVIDPMHNLLLGTAKHMVEIWKKRGILTDKELDIIQEKVDSFVAIPDVGRMPTKISSAFSGFTAQQWKNFTIFFSLYALKGILPPSHYNCWHLFVKATYLYCRRTITEEQLREADTYIMLFCDRVVFLYQKDACTINMHLHGHLAECVRSYGPVYSFWLFAYERLNGVMGSYHTNGHNISLQFARRFFGSNAFAPCNWPTEFVDEFYPILERFNYRKGALVQETFSTVVSKPSCTPLPPVREDAFLSWEIETLKEMGVGDGLLRLYQKTTAVQVGNFVLGAKSSRHGNSSVLLAKRSNHPDNICLCEVKYFVRCAVKNGEEHSYVWVAAVSWFMNHQCKVWFGSPCQVWSSVTTDPSYSFVLIEDIVSRVLYTKSNVDFGRFIGSETVVVVVPLDV